MHNYAQYVLWGKGLVLDNRVGDYASEDPWKTQQIPLDPCDIICFESGCMSVLSTNCGHFQMVLSLPLFVSGSFQPGQCLHKSITIYMWGC